MQYRALPLATPAEDDHIIADRIAALQVRLGCGPVVLDIDDPRLSVEVFHRHIRVVAARRDPVLIGFDVHVARVAIEPAADAPGDGIRHVFAVALRGDGQSVSAVLWTQFDPQGLGPRKAAQQHGKGDCIAHLIPPADRAK